MKRASTLVALIALGIGAIISIQPTTVHAQSANAADGMQISPVIAELNVDPGKTYIIPITITNVTGSDLTFNVIVNDFASKDETGTPSIDLDSLMPSTASIQSWVTPISPLNILARQPQTIEAELVVPSNAEPGGHYGVIRFSGRPTGIDTTGVSLSASAGTLVLVRVSGDVQESLDLLEFYTSQDDTQSSLFARGPIKFVTRFQNEGNVHVKPVGQIEVRDMFNNTVDTLAINETKGNILPDSIRRFDTVLEKEWMFGRYTADIAVSYGTAGQAIVRTIAFWVIPWRLIIGIVIAIATIVFILITVMKRYNKYIVNKALHGKDGTKKKSKK